MLSEREKYTYKNDENKHPYQTFPECVFRDMMYVYPTTFWGNALNEFVNKGNSSMVVAYVVEVMIYGKEKYGKWNSWKTIEDAQNRFFGAYIRHKIEYDQNNDAIDPESGLSHEKHMLWNMVVLCYFELQEKRN